MNTELARVIEDTLARIRKHAEMRRIKLSQTRELASPGILSLNGRTYRKPFKVKYSKPPKTRYKPGQFVVYDGEFWVIVYMYRTRQNPNEWIHCLEDIPAFKSRQIHEIDQLVAALGAGNTTPRIVYDEFRDSMDAQQYFFDIPCRGTSRVNLKTKDMLNKTKLLGVAPTTIIS